MGVLAILHPDLHCNSWFPAKAAELRSQLAQASASGDPTLSHAANAEDLLPRFYFVLLTYQMPAGSLAAFVEKLHARNSYRDLLEEVARLREKEPRLGRNGLRPSEIVVILDETSDEARLLLRVATDSWLVRQHLDQYQRRFRHVRPSLTGDDLRRMGLPPGRLYSQILSRLRAAHLDGEISSRIDEERLVGEIFAAQRAAEA
jgi:tRNA nucleotidyltransferase (CCA-adding enzyme)